MHSCGIATVLFVFLKTALALSNTSPVIVLSDTKPLDTSLLNSEDTIAVPMDHILTSLISSASHSCQYNSYIFVTHPGVSERDINKQTMPFLTHAMQKAEGKYLSDAAVHNEGIKESIDSLKELIEAQCNALPITADTQGEVPFPPVIDTRSRIITVEFDDGISVTEADSVLRKVVGHLASGNFLMAYRTTPKQTAEAISETDSASTSTDPQSFSKSEVQTPYESLFRNYQFFSPGLLMGLIVSTLLIVVFLIALNSVGSLQISAAAFEPKRQPTKKQ